MNHPLSSLERDLHAAAAPRPPDFHGSKLNQFRRRVALESWIRHHYGDAHASRARRLEPRAADARALGPWLPWIRASRAELAAVQRVAKHQAAMRHARASR